MAKQDETKEVDIKHLEDAIRLFLLRGRGQDEKEDDERDQEIRIILKELEDVSANDRFFHNEFHFINPQKEARGLMLMLRECIISHRWKPTLQLLVILVSYLPDTQSAVFKAGLEVFFQIGGDNMQLAEQFLALLKTAEGCWNRKEIVIEFTLYLMSQGEYQRAKEHLKGVGTVRKFNRNFTEHIQHWEKVYKIYQGLSYYMSWWMCTKEIKEMQEASLDGPEQEEMLEKLRMEEDSQRKNADLALDCLQDLHKAPGIWDTLILKHIELLEFKGMPETALEVLTIYQKNNPSNPNAFRYLYEFYLRHKEYEDNVIDVLKNFCDMVPSDSLCLELHSRYLEKGKSPGSVLYLLFDLLDHFQWQDVPEAWKLFSEQLQLALSSPEDLPYIHDCWRDRKSWWPAYHFRKDQTVAITTQQEECLPHKGYVAAALLRKDNDFTNSLRDQGLLTEEQIETLLTLPNKAKS